MDSSCLRNDSLTNSFFWTMHLTLLISLPVNALGIYCVTFKSPSYMQRYKWCVLHHMFWVMVLDIHITTLVIPDFLFPLPAVHVMGLLLKIFPMKLVAVIGISSAGSLVATLLHLFVYRHQAIIPQYHRRHMSKPVRYSLLALIYLYFSGCSLPILFMIPNEQGKAKQEMIDNQCAPKEFFHEETVIIQSEKTLFMYIYMLVFVFIGASLGTGLMLDAFYFLNSSISQLSQQVKQLHMTALRMLIIQVSIPALFLATPMTVLLIGSIFGYTGQVVTYAVLQIVAFHGTIGTIVMILMSPSYRKFVFKQQDSSRTVRMTPVTTMTLVREELRRF